MPSSQVNCKRCDVDNTWSSELYLSGFGKDQDLVIVAYKQREGKCFNIGDFYQAYNVTVDSNGNLEIYLSGNLSNVFIYSVYDKQTGRLEWQWYLSLQEADCMARDISQNSNYACTNTIETQIIKGDNVRVTYSNGIPVRLRSEPVIKSSTFITQFNEGTQLEVLDGPSCNEGYVWWYVQSGKYKGWIAEGTSSNWFIEPVE